MKTKFAILNPLLLFAVLFSILLQYFHTYEHLAKQFSEKKCTHAYHLGDQITHEHHKYDHCFLCNFTLSNYISSDVSSFSFKRLIVSSSITLFDFLEIPVSFCGSLFALRGPPIV